MFLLKECERATIYTKICHVYYIYAYAGLHFIYIHNYDTMIEKKEEE